MRFIHAADIHLDSPLHGLSAYADAPADMLRNATREAFSKLVSVAVDEQVDFMVIAGDLYDGTWRDHNTGIFFCREMGRLRRAGIPVYVLFGNHDAESEMTSQLQLPDNVHTFSTRKPQTFLIEDLKVALHGHSFKEKAVTTNLVTAYPAPVAGYFNIGVLHTALEGGSMHASYAPCSVAELHAKEYHYWALGHVHDYAIWQDASTIVFPGNLQGRNIRETGRRGAVIVNVSDAEEVSVERLFIDVLRWEAVTVDASQAGTLDEVALAVGRALEALVESSAAPVPHAVRVTIAGATAAHGELFGLEAQLRAEVLAQIAAISHDRLWLEKVRIATEPLAHSEPATGRTDALADLHGLLIEAESDPEFLSMLKERLIALASQAPSELQKSVPELERVRNGEIAKLVAEVRSGLIAQLSDAE
ncbi:MULTISPECIES: DNA repair exonuclease [Caballeronia]|jgi:DNA repair protein SbcD/Mre11|uniref:Metallophosphoesterase n=1 Tax=Caballeronia zhejiangensis TaxID=871203 RepID=A0A656QN72_9BURK|nr:MULTISPECIES: DNA repair exonuclease [Caballeronia]KDR31326.1 metallophosphoesterase [Caballeronia zhejiangensis]MCG7402376.1 DNA repair exonuclease [Caballeronia zhejiangensis]MCI1045125.1 DNA repair exonuclease [Caballeronia zhejiangensis]MDR5786512.1 DNA repair exonuclease [Caballeronia sp. LP003]MDR5793854.1 DNA repair exonuclease [Caballeronia sp. LZ008]